MSYSIRVDESRCIGCGACARECHRHLPVYRNGQQGSNGLECVGCLHCFAVCPRGAVTVDGIEPVADGGTRIEPDALRALAAGRRSCRRFEDRPLQRELLEELTRTAAYIPSGGNAHCHRLTVLGGGETRKRPEAELVRIYRKRKRLLGSRLLRGASSLLADPQTRAFLRDGTYFTRVSYLMEQIARGEDPIFYNAPAVVLVHSPRLIPTPREDSVLSAYNIVLAAETMGLGSCFVSLAQNAVNSSAACTRILGLDPREQVYAVVVIGHPAVRFHRAAPRPALPVAWPR